MYGEDTHAPVLFLPAGDQKPGNAAAERWADVVARASSDSDHSPGGPKCTDSFPSGLPVDPDLGGGLGRVIRLATDAKQIMSLILKVRLS